MRQTDDHTKVCQQCFDKIDKYFRFRNLCIATNISFLLHEFGMGISDDININTPNTDDAFVELNLPLTNQSNEENSLSENIFECENLTNNEDEAAPIMCITVTDTDSSGDDNDINNINLRLPAKRNKLPAMTSKQSLQQPIRQTRNPQCPFSMCVRKLFTKRGHKRHMTHMHEHDISTFCCYFCKKTDSHKKMHPQPIRSSNRGIDKSKILPKSSRRNRYLVGDSAITIKKEKVDRDTVPSNIRSKNTRHSKSAKNEKVIRHPASADDSTNGKENSDFILSFDFTLFCESIFLRNS